MERISRPRLLAVCIVATLLNAAAGGSKSPSPRPARAPATRSPDKDVTAPSPVSNHTSKTRSKNVSSCTVPASASCQDGSTKLSRLQACEPLCSPEATPLGLYVCNREGEFTGPGCANAASLPSLEASDVDAVADAIDSSDMVFHKFKLVNGSACLIYPKLPTEVKAFILEQAGKYGPSAAAINSLKKLGTTQKTEFFLSIEQVSVLLAQLLCGANSPASGKDFERDGMSGAQDHPQSFAFGRAMEHWFFAEDGTIRDPKWRRTTLVGYGTFDNDKPVPDGTSTVSTASDLVMTSGCGTGKLADWGLGDANTMTVVFAGHYIGGFMTGWHKANMYGAQEEKIGTLVPEMMLATEPLRQMGAGLLSSGTRDPWLPEAGWYIIGAGTYVKSKGYPFWTPDKVPLSDTDDYFAVGTGRQIRKRGLVAILAKPCNDRGAKACNDNTDEPVYKCYNQQVADHDIAPASKGGGANLWGVAGGAFNFENWPSKTRQFMEEAKVVKNWVLQAGGWGAGAFGCGTLYNGLVQALAAKKGGWSNMRMCYATREEPYPSLKSKLSYAIAQPEELKAAKVVNAEHYKPLLTYSNHAEVAAMDYHGGSSHSSSHHSSSHASSVHHPTSDSHSSSHVSSSDRGQKGAIIFKDSQFGSVAEQLYKKIEQKVLPPVCFEDEDAPPLKCNKPGSQGTCMSNMDWCCNNEVCDWHKHKSVDLRDFAGKTCNTLCSKASHICKIEHVPEKCRKSINSTKASKDYVPAKPPPESKFHSNKYHNPAPRPSYSPRPRPSYKTAYYKMKAPARSRDFMTYEEDNNGIDQSQPTLPPEPPSQPTSQASASAPAYPGANEGATWISNAEGNHPYARSHASEGGTPDFNWFTLTFVAGLICVLSGVTLLIAPKSWFEGERATRGVCLDDEPESAFLVDPAE